MTQPLGDLTLRTAADLDPPWLGAVLGRTVDHVDSVTSVGTGQMSHSYRVTFRSAGNTGTVVVKLASTDETSRRTGIDLGLYSREVAFYQTLAPKMGDSVPACFYASYDVVEGWFTLVLEDIADATQGDQILGCSPEQAATVMQRLAACHAPVLGDPSVGAEEWLNAPSALTGDLMALLLPQFLDRYQAHICPEHAEVCRRFALSMDAWMADLDQPMGLVHGDFRLDNLLFAESRCTVVDWQTVSWGPAITDVSYFLGGGLNVEDRRAHERNLVDLYAKELRAQGVVDVSDEHCWDQYRRQVFLGLAMVIAPAMLVQQTARGDEMFMTLLDRVCHQIVDLGSLDFLPAAGEK